MEALLRQRLQAGSRLAHIDLGDNGAAASLFTPKPEADWFFKAMDEAIAENRLREDEKGK